MSLSLIQLTLAGVREGFSRSSEILGTFEVDRRCYFLRHSVTKNANGKHSRMGCLDSRIHE